MTDLDTSASDMDPVDEIRIWLKENWDPDLTLREWWQRLGLAGWAAPNLPPHAYGRGLSNSDTVRVQQAIADFGALGAAWGTEGIGIILAAPTIATHGTPEQIEAFVRPSVTGEIGWCQLFSEPGAGSDLAGITTRAERDGDEWVVTGQKVWTSGGQNADFGLLMARTDWDVAKHAGITYFAIDMRQEGVETRPLRELTGRAVFSEVFMNEARVPDSARIGELNQGWAVANTTLAYERVSLGTGASSGNHGGAVPGTIAGDLDKRVGDFLTRSQLQAQEDESSGEQSDLGSVGLYFALARKLGKLQVPSVRQKLTDLYIINELGRLNNLRDKAGKAVGKEIPGSPNLAKLAMSDLAAIRRDVGMEILGMHGTLHGYSDEEREALEAITSDPTYAEVTEAALFAQAPPIYGGTDQIQRNIIGERVLGLPKEPNEHSGKAFREVPKNA